ncbi:MAG TPA: hypothetical protein VGR02_07850 [Thermoanaerobaculia bacterium]|jgi:hypothetical protein|nr:hypothetical protein [Thermoanaerobaculia bacterium]
MRRAGTIALLFLLAAFVCLAVDGDVEELGPATVSSRPLLTPPPPTHNTCAVAPVDGVRTRDALGVFHPPRRS